MELHCQLSQEDFREALAAYRNRNPILKWLRRLLVVVIVGLPVFALILYFKDPETHPVANLFPLFVLAILWSAFFWCTPWLAARRQFTKQPSAQGPRSLSIDDNGLRRKWDGGSSDISWKAYTRLVESKGMFLLFTSLVVFNLIPKRALAAEQQEEFRRLVSEHLPKR